MKEPEYEKLVEFIRNGLSEQVHFGLIIYMNKNGVIKKIGEDVIIVDIEERVLKYLFR